MKEIRALQFIAAVLCVIGYAIYAVVTYGMHPLCQEVPNPIVEHVILPTVGIAWCFLVVSSLGAPFGKDKS